MEAVINAPKETEVKQEDKGKKKKKIYFCRNIINNILLFIKLL